MSKWLDNAIFYEIYPQSFKDTNGDGIGDFQGIIEKLDYIRELGCNALWINPCFLSPFGDAGYDVADYCRVAPRYGTNEDLKQLFEEAHKKGIHVLLDLVPGHTSIEHPWFIESMKADKNPYTDRYIWTDKVWESPEVSFGGSLRGISERDGAVAVNFFSNQPALNYGFYQPDPEKPWQQSIDDEGPQATIAAMEDVMRFWLGMGCDGFRVDMAESLVKMIRRKKEPSAYGNRSENSLIKNSRMQQWYLNGVIRRDLWKVDSTWISCWSLVLLIPTICSVVKSRISLPVQKEISTIS